MAAKRLLDGSGRDPAEPDGKRMRTRPSFAAVISEVVMVKSLQNFCSALEPLLRKVVNEEVENGVRRSARLLQRSPSLQLRALEPSNYKLSFSNKLSLPVFTGSKIEDVDNKPLQIFLMNTEGDREFQTSLPQPIKVEIVVLDGDFLSDDRENWSGEEFNNKIVRERTGKRPLLAGEVFVTLRDGSASIGELSFTDNSSWIRSRNFRLGARVAPGSYQGVRIREAKTEPFMVKDHRGELYKKHYPPMLTDEVWRLEKIGKDGAFHKKLISESIGTVQDFLKLWVVDSAQLRNILGLGMSDKMWETTIKHAKTCLLGNKLYRFRGPRFTLILNPICQVVETMLDGKTYSACELTPFHRAHIEQLVKNAYRQWDSLEEVDGLLTENALLGPGDMEAYSTRHQNIIMSNQQSEFSTEAFIEVGTVPSNPFLAYNSWPQNPTYFTSQIESSSAYNMSESSSDGDSTPSLAYFNGV
ncbi:PREDICTED: protein SAR DEFICIENT 1-like [Nelumbo nucifera]|uniref:Protein SAR DEFICIENT 1-like n=1 Tax=Nelumbo nucifera TaxID=4432 RepID=A0A1U8AP78_NELNU|nr:PREDICTED: protein SAR DEFICIENT 1-like [Nelumbo nucifera]